MTLRNPKYGGSRVRRSLLRCRRRVADRQQRRFVAPVPPIAPQIGLAVAPVPLRARRNRRAGLATRAVRDVAQSSSPQVKEAFKLPLRDSPHPVDHRISSPAHCDLRLDGSGIEANETRFIRNTPTVDPMRDSCLGYSYASGNRRHGQWPEQAVQRFQDGSQFRPRQGGVLTVRRIRIREFVDISFWWHSPPQPSVGDERGRRYSGAPKAIGSRPSQEGLRNTSSLHACKEAMGQRFRPDGQRTRGNQYEGVHSGPCAAVYASWYK